MAGLQTSAFFFSSRRRHTRCSRDWSSDVCSSDLGVDLADVEDTHDVGVVETLEGVGLALEAGAELGGFAPRGRRSEEHTSELQSRLHLVCRLLLEKKKKQHSTPTHHLLQPTTHVT